MRNIFLYLIALPADTNEKYANAWRQNVCFSIRIWFDFTACPQVSSVLWHCRHHLGTTATGWLYRATANGGGFYPALLVVALLLQAPRLPHRLGQRTPLLQTSPSNHPGAHSSTPPPAVVPPGVLTRRPPRPLAVWRDSQSSLC